MKTKTVKVTKLKNKYTNEIVLCNDINKVDNDGKYSFIEVYNETNPNRKFLVNKESFTILN
jgi:hypothetical protein